MPTGVRTKERWVHLYFIEFQEMLMDENREKSSQWMKMWKKGFGEDFIGKTTKLV